MSKIMMATVHLPGGFAKGTEREVDETDAQVKEWIDAGFLAAPTGGQRAAAKRAKKDEEPPTTSGQGIGETVTATRIPGTRRAEA